MTRRLVRTLACAALLAASLSAIAQKADPWLRPKEIPHPEDNKPSKARQDLGRMLFFDPRLSGSNWISCATCHNPALGWSDGLPTAIGNSMKVLGRSTPTILNTAYNKILMWDGRKPNLEEQALGPIGADVEMGQNVEELVKELSAIEGYRKAFEKAYPGEGITEKTIGKALANFERTVVSQESPFDRWRKGDQGAITESAKRGFAVFTGRGNCASCHMGFNFTDDGFHNIGVKEVSGEVDIGRYAHRKVKVLKGAFKTPTLRDIALTAPYMRNGIYRTLEEVVDHYDRGGDVKDNLSPNIRPLGLTDTEKADLVAFMKTLTGKQVPVFVPTLPQ